MFPILLELQLNIADGERTIVVGQGDGEIVQSLLEMAGWSRPWEPGRIAELPETPVTVPAAAGEDEVVS